MVEDLTEPESASVGEILREGREQRNISIAEIAHQMHLDSRIIRALEEDDYDYLPDPIYVRGYIRNYCKLLGKEAEDILDLFMTNSGGKDPEIIPEIKHHSQTSSSDKPVKAFTYLISLALVILLIAWWQSNFIINSDTTTPAPVSTDDDITQLPVEEISIPDEPVVEEIETDTVDALIPDVSDDTIEEDSISEEETSVTENTEELNDSPTVQPFLQTDDQLSIDLNEESGPNNSSTSTTPPPISAANAAEAFLLEPQPQEFVASTGPDTLILTVSADSWIEIYDVNLQRVYFDLGRRGDRLTLYGTAPFEILLGFAQGVAIEFNGEPVEQAPFTRSGVARFTLGE